MRRRARVVIAAGAGSAAAVLVVRSDVSRAWASLRSILAYGLSHPPAGDSRSKPRPETE